MRPWHNLHILDHAMHFKRLPTSTQDTKGGGTATLVKRSTCAAGDTSPTCQLPTGSPDTVSIVLATVIPVVFVLAVLIFLHRRHVKKQRKADENDKYSSLDFGLGENYGPSKPGRKAHQDMTDNGMTDVEFLRRTRGMSMDMSSPYVLPGELHDSRGSVHSLSRSAHESEDRYRPVTFVMSGSSTPRYPSSRDAASLKTISSDSASMGRSNLLRHAQQPPRSTPPAGSLVNTPRSESSSGRLPTEVPATLAAPNSRPDGTQTNLQVPNEAPRQTINPEANQKRITQGPPDRRLASSPLSNDSNSSRPLDRSSVNTINTAQIEAGNPAPPNTSTYPSSGRSQVSAPMKSALHGSKASGALGDSASHARAQDSSQGLSAPALIRPSALATIHEPPPTGLGVQGLEKSTRRLSISRRPLPPNHPNDTAEQSANRIRSFYREYFDESKPGRAQPGPVDYYEDYGQEFLNDATIFDPETGQFIVAGAPYAQPVTRRAMTPPPRAPPRFRTSSAGYGVTAAVGMTPVRRARAFSSMSDRPVAGPRGRAPMKQFPPPMPLTTLPTPHLLKNDSAIFSSVDFAPPASYRDRQAGRSGSPRGFEQRAYSPSVKAYDPLTSPYQDLAVMPSPHALRNSSSFNGLDFAAPLRFKSGESNAASDVGSVRSGRSGTLSQVHHANIRAGAYRVSRIPRDVVGTKDDFAASLKPTWELRA